MGVFKDKITKDLRQFYIRSNYTKGIPRVWILIDVELQKLIKKRERPFSKGISVIKKYD